MLQNQGGGAGFIDVAPALGLDDPTGEGTGALFGDYDNDGDADLYVLNRGDNVMFRNDGSDGGDVDVEVEVDVATTTTTTTTPSRSGNTKSIRKRAKPVNPGKSKTP